MARKGEGEIGRGGEIWVVTGWRDAGKTTFCSKMAQSARDAGWDVAGILTLGEVQDGQKTGFSALNLRSGEQRSLIALKPYPRPGIILGPWHFDPETLAWADRIFQEATPCDLLVVDELGPLEMLENRGWMSALIALKSRQFRLALAVVRPELAGEFSKSYRITRTIELKSPQEAAGLASREAVTFITQSTEA